MRTFLGPPCGAESGAAPPWRLRANGQPGTADNSPCGPHSAIGRLDVGCSGTLVRNNIVITAHHCFPQVGTKFSFPDVDANFSSTVTKVSYAPNWEGNANTAGPNDIAVLQLDSAIPRYLAEPLWLLIDPPQTYPGLSLWPYYNPPYSSPELVGYGSQRYNSGPSQERDAMFQSFRCSGPRIPVVLFLRELVGPTPSGSPRTT